MAKKKGAAGALDPVAAVSTIHDALRSFSSDDRDRILASVTALLGMQAPGVSSGTGGPVAAQASTQATPSDRPQSIREMIENALPATNAQFIAVFAYYRERVEGLSRFARSDLRTYFSRARLKPPANFDRDFANAILAGWIHEDGADSYLTSKGVEAVQAGFAGKRLPGSKPKSKALPKGKKARR